MKTKLEESPLSSKAEHQLRYHALYRDDRLRKLLVVAVLGTDAKLLHGNTVSGLEDADAMGHC